LPKLNRLSEKNVLNVKVWKMWLLESILCRTFVSIIHERSKTTHIHSFISKKITFALMKKVIFSLAFFFALGISFAQAQSCHSAAAAKSCSSASAGKSCCAGKMASAAAADPSIEKRVADNGAVSYVRKEADQQGNVRFVSVQFDEASNAFVNVAPKTMTADEKMGATKKEACMSGEKKACCASKAAGKSCAGAKVEK
jgi:hypothetical protein